jgi:hypothetical protein
MLPYANAKEVIGFAKKYQVDLIVIDERLAERGWEFYDDLINMDKYKNDVELVYMDKTNKLIKLFKVKNR